MWKGWTSSMFLGECEMQKLLLQNRLPVYFKTKHAIIIWYVIYSYTLSEWVIVAVISMWLSRQVYGSGLPWPSPGDFLDWGNETMSLTSSALAGSLPLAPSGNP